MARELIIGGRRIADDEPAVVIAEIGHNHGGSVQCAKRMIEVASWAGCDAVKLQKRSLQDCYTAAMLDAPYNSEHSYGSSYGEHRAILEFNWEQHAELKAYAESVNLIYLCTAFDEPSATLLAGLHLPVVKIASGDLVNLPLIEHCASLKLPLLVSTGGHEITDVDRSFELLHRLGARFALLQATATYPCCHEELNLRVIETYRERYPDTVIGLSDHQDGISMAPVAWMLGARIFEKHFTLSRAAKGSDNAFSLEPEPMRRMVNDLRGVSAALGDGVKRAYASEAPAMAKMAKSIVAARDLPAGHSLEPGDIAVKSPGGGMPPYKLYWILGQRLRSDILTDEPLTEEALCSSSTHR